MKYFIAVRSKTNSSEALEEVRRHSPNIEIVDENTLVFDLTGSKVEEASRIVSGLREKFEAVAVSENLAEVLLLVRFQVQEAEDLPQKEQTRNLPSAPDELFKVKKSDYRAGRLINSGREFNAQIDRNPPRTAKVQVRGEEDRPPNTQKEQTRNLPSMPDQEDRSRNTQKEQTRAPHLAALPLDAISQKADFLDLMDSWAVHNLGEFCQLPEDEMVARFGKEIIELRKKASGKSFRSVNWNVKEDKFFWATDLEGGIETIEPLNFVLTKGVEEIFKNLDYAGLSTQSVKIILRGRKKRKIFRIRIVFPTKNQKLWIRQIVTKIELDTPRFNIDRVEIEFRSTRPRTVQNNLYSGAILEPENLNLIVSKLKKVVGLTKIGLPKLRDSWSEPFYMTEDLAPLIKDFYQESGEQGFRSTFYYFPQPIKARVFFESGEPKALLLKGKREMVRTSGGPWRKDFEWYKAKDWKRDEWDIETETGAIYRVFTDKNGEAFVDGGYD